MSDSSSSNPSPSEQSASSTNPVATFFGAIGGVGGVLLGMLAFLLLAGLLILFRAVQTPENSDEARKKGRLEVRATVDEQWDELRTAAWLDEQAGTVRLPVESAMEATLTELKEKKPSDSGIAAATWAPPQMPAWYQGQPKMPGAAEAAAAAAADAQAAEGEGGETESGPETADSDNGSAEGEATEPAPESSAPADAPGSDSAVADDEVPLSAEDLGSPDAEEESADVNDGSPVRTGAEADPSPLR